MPGTGSVRSVRAGSPSATLSARYCTTMSSWSRSSASMGLPVDGVDRQGPCRSRGGEEGELKGRSSGKTGRALAKRGYRMGGERERVGEQAECAFWLRGLRQGTGRGWGGRQGRGEQVGGQVGGCSVVADAQGCLPLGVLGNLTFECWLGVGRQV
eukprot:365009-Chlamydomonas_euryale.AAC.12